MSFLSILDSLFLEPFKAFFEIVFYIINQISKNVYVPIIVLGLLTGLLLVLISGSLHGLRESLNERRNKFLGELKEIKSNNGGEERKTLIKNYLKQNKAFPFYFLSDFVYLLFWVPIFIAMYFFFANLSVIQDVPLGQIENLASPDALIKFGSFAINILPTLVFLVGVASVVLYTLKSSWQARISLLLYPVITAIFLWKAPAALSFELLVSSAICLLYVVKHKFPKTKLYVDLSMSAVGVGLLILGIFHPASLVPGGVLQLPILLYLFKNILIKKLLKIKKVGEFFAKFKTEKPSKLQFIVNALLLTIFIGLFIPSTYIAASPLEYINSNLFFNPLNYVLVSFLIAAGIFLIWTTLFYFVSGSKTRIVIEKVLFIYSIVMLVDYMFFGLKLGIITATLSYETGLVFTILELVLNVIVVIAICLFFAFAYKKIKSYISFLLILIVVVFSGMSAFNVVSAAKPINEYKKYNLNKSDINFSLTKTGHNVVVIMLDRALGQYIPFIFKELPELKERFDGFTHYSNTLSHGFFTNIATPALLGGYEYTPVEINKRDDESLMEKNNEANLVMPRIFAEQGYKVSVADPVYINYQWLSDLSVFDEYEGINAFHTMGQFVDKKQTSYIYQLTLSNFFRFSFMKTLPLFMQSVLYDGGNYNNFEPMQKVGDDNGESSDKKVWYGNQKEISMSKSTGISHAFMTNYTTLQNLEKMTMINSDETNTFLFLRNDLTHEPMLLDEKNGYIPSRNIDNTEYDNENSDRFTLEDGRKLNISNYTQMIHYQTNVAALIQVANWLDYLRETGTYNNTRIILASDHGRDVKTISELTYQDVGLELCCPLLMVKDFNETGFKTSTEFMTNADVPTLATRNLGFTAKNPFTGKEINMNEKTAHPQIISRSFEWNIANNNGNTFKESWWLKFDSTKQNCNIYDLDNWDYLRKEVVLKDYSFD